MINILRLSTIILLLLTSKAAFAAVPSIDSTSFTGLGLIFLGLGFMVAEIFITSLGILAVIGILLFIIGSMFLLQSGLPGNEIAWLFVFVFTALAAVFFLVAARLGWIAKFKPIQTGREELIGKTGDIIKDTQGLVRIRLQGELWQVKSQQDLKSGEKVKVIGLQGLILVVEPLEKKS